MNPAIFARASYKMGGSGDKETRLQAAQDVLDEEGNEEGWTVEPKFSNRNMVVFTTEDGIHISPRGTNVTRRKDLVADLSIALGREEKNKSFGRIKTQILNTLKAYPDHTATGSSHSLGGSTLYNAALSNKYIGERFQRIDTYNQGISPFSGRVPKKKAEDFKDKVFIHRTKGDLVSASALYNKPYGKIITYDPIQEKSNTTKKLTKGLSGLGFSLEKLNAHSIKNFI